MSEDSRRRKRFRREHRTPTVEVVYRCKDEGERLRRLARAKNMIGTPYLRLPGNRDQHEIAFITADGTPVPVGAVEMVYNDMLLMDAISDHGKDGPLYASTISERQREILNWGIAHFRGVE